MSQLIQFAHIGLPKSASTWLQTSLFAHHPDLQVITKTGAYTPEPYNALKDFRTQPPEDFDAAYWQERFAAEFSRYLDWSKTIGISDEEFANGGIMHNDPTMLWRIQRVFGDIKIILVLRHPIQYLRSAYGEYISKGGRQSPDQFYKPERAARLAKRIDFPALVQDVQRLFSADNILILPFEMIVQEGEQAFADAICDFLKVTRVDIQTMVSKGERNRGLTTASLPFFRYCNTFDKAITEKLFKNAPRLRAHYALDLFLKRVPLDKNAPRLPLPPVELVARLSEVERILKTERYQFWRGELSRYNYDLGAYDFSKHPEKVKAVLSKESAE